MRSAQSTITRHRFCSRRRSGSDTGGGGWYWVVFVRQLQRPMSLSAINGRLFFCVWLKRNRVVSLLSTYLRLWWLLRVCTQHIHPKPVRGRTAKQVPDLGNADPREWHHKASRPKLCRILHCPFEIWCLLFKIYNYSNTSNNQIFYTSHHKIIVLPSVTVQSVLLVVLYCNSVLAHDFKSPV